MSRNIRITEDPVSGMTLREYTHSCGAKAVCACMETSLCAASVSLPFGGGISGIAVDGFGELPAFPGSAHFAEHMIFTGGGGRLDRFCALGADANAETSMTGTTYYITAGEKFLYALGDLASMVIKPSFNKDELEKERDIILREKAEDDDIFTKSRNALTDLIYKSGSVRREIIGDRKSIKKMNADLLRGIYNCAYLPSVMGFAAVSPENCDKVFDMIDAALFGNAKCAVPDFRIIQSKMRTGGKHVTKIKNDGEATMMLCGIPFDLSDCGLSYERRQVYSSMLEAMLFDRTEYIGTQFRERGEGIYGSLRSDTSIFFDDMLLSASVSCDDPESACELYLSIFEEAKKKGARACFKNIEAKRRSLVADYLSVFDSPSDLSLTLSEYAAAGASFHIVANELINFSENDFFEFAEKVLAKAEVYFVEVV